MNYSFDVDLAMKYGVEESIMLANIIHWIQKNKANGKHLHDGRTWTYNSINAFTVLYPFWTKKQIERILKSLKDQGAILVGNYNESAYDRTCWYSVTNENNILIGTSIADFPKKENGNPEKGKPIPDIKPDIKEDVTPLFSENTPEYYLSKKMYDEILSNRSTMKKPDIQKWCISFDLIHRIDKRDYDWLMELISLVYKDNFWKNQIRSPEKLRKQLNEGKLDMLANQIKTWETDSEVIEALNA